MELTWIFKKFEDLTPAELYAIIQLRNEVFIMEQNCIYQDADNKDQPSWHLAGWDTGKLVAYSRIIPPGIAFKECSIGRVASSPAHRNTGAGRELMKESISKAFDQFNCNSIKIGAQLYLKKFYNALGFIQCSEQYLEDGIPHIEMLLLK